mgnify:CR=1 FL=1
MSSKRPLKESAWLEEVSLTEQVMKMLMLCLHKSKKPNKRSQMQQRTLKKRSQMQQRSLMKPSPSFLRLLQKTRKSTMHRTLSLKILGRIRIDWLGSWETSKPPRPNSKRPFHSSCQAWLCRALKALWRGSSSSWASNSSKCSKRSSAKCRALMVPPQSEKTRQSPASQDECVTWELA